MSALHYSFLFLLYLHLMMPLCAARAVLQSHGNNPITPSSVTTSSQITGTAAPDSPAEKRGREGPTLGQTLIVSLAVGLLIYLIYNLALLVIKHHGCRFHLNIRPTLPVLFRCVSRACPPAVPPRHDSVLPLQQLAREPPLPTGSSHEPFPTTFPRAPEPREPAYLPPQFRHSSNASDSGNASQFSLAPSETPTVVPERTPRRGF
ncbi:hypothetical protein B0H19DRAFT_1076392 [Mycena capillaripes]|nr:hypothetical protein B0H19DRAFT_1076392 [Mycena capillaripes]